MKEKVDLIAYILIPLSLMGALHAGFFKNVINKIWSTASKCIPNQILNQGANNKELNKELNESEFEVIPKESVANYNQKHVIDINKLALFDKDKWVNMPQSDIESNFGTLALAQGKKMGIRSLRTYVPHDYILGKKPIVMFVIHGTFAALSPEYYKPGEIFYKNVINFAEKLANKYKVPVEIVSFQWLGHNITAARQNAGIFLASILNNFYSAYKIYTIAHSHGCNVVNNASRLLQNVMIDHMIHISCPVRDVAEEQFRPENFNRLVQFYSNSDLVGAIGAFTAKHLSSLAPRKFALQKNREIHNIRALIDGADPGHSNSKDYVVYFLDEILNILEDKYEFNNDLVIDIKTNVLKKPHVLIAVRAYLDPGIYAGYPGIQAALEKEREYSEEQKKLFKDYYKKDMNIKHNVFYRFLNGVYQEAISL